MLTLCGVLGALVAGVLIGRAAAPTPLPDRPVPSPRLPTVASEGPSLTAREPTDLERRLRAEVERLSARIKVLEAEAESPTGVTDEPASPDARGARLAAVRRASVELAAAEAALLPEDHHRPFPADKADATTDLPGWGSPSRVHRVLALDDVPAYSSWAAGRASRYTLDRLSQLSDPQARSRVDAIVRRWIATELDAMLGARRAWSGMTPARRDEAQRAYGREAFDRRVEAADQVRRELEAVLGSEAYAVRVDLLP